MRRSAPSKAAISSALITQGAPRQSCRPLISPRWIIRKATGKKQLIIAGVVTEVCVAFPALSALEEGYEVFVVTDASGTFNEITRHSAWDRMSAAGAQLMTWFGVAGELHRDWRNDVEGLGTLFSNHIPDYRNLITAYTATQAANKARVA